VWEIPYFPAYYIPVDDVRKELLVESAKTEHSPSRGDATFFNVKTDFAEATDAAWTYPGSPVEELRDAIRFDWEAMDDWFEEDEQVYVHPRDPYSRVDILRSSRHVEVEVGGVRVADSVRPVLLFETGLPVRYYLPKTDVRLDLLTPSATTSRCPYKGTAEYYSVTVDGTTFEDVVWWYRLPAHESAGIAGLVSFYNEKVDIILDGVRLDRPGTNFS
jgi:uncharacterized protein (DUF427 family)